MILKKFTVLRSDDPGKPCGQYERHLVREIVHLLVEIRHITHEIRLKTIKLRGG